MNWSLTPILLPIRCSGRSRQIPSDPVHKIVPTRFATTYSDHGESNHQTFRAMRITRSEWSDARPACSSNPQSDKWNAQPERNPQSLRQRTRRSPAPAHAASSASAARSRRTRRWSAGAAGRGSRCSRRRAATDADIPRTDRTCRWCELLPPYVRAARSVCWASGRVGLGVVHALKYQGWHRVADEMAARMARLAWPTDVRRGTTRARARSARRAKRRASAATTRAELLARALARQWSTAGVGRRVARVRAHRDANAVDTRGPTSQRFGRVSRAGIGAERAPRRASSCSSTTS